MRPTRQRVALGRLLFAGDDRHVTAEMLHEEAVRVGQRVSLATDIPGSSVRVEGLPQPPDHLRIAHIDVVVRLVRK